MRYWLASIGHKGLQAWLKPPQLISTDNYVWAKQRILTVDYQLPYNEQVSAGCRDLLHRILVADPRMRITIADIQRHPWFTRDLPDGLAQMNDQLITDQQQQ